MDTLNNKAMVLADAIVGEVIETIHTQSLNEPGNEAEKLSFYAQVFQYSFQILARKLLVLTNRETILKLCDQALSVDIQKTDSSH